ncbi:carbohydrate sulfotransferase 1-like isoform X2 [Ptychodera flava]
MKKFALGVLFVFMAVFNIMVYNGYQVIYTASQQPRLSDISTAESKRSLQDVGETWKSVDNGIVNRQPGLRIILVGAFRTGSTFIGEMLNQNPSIFYMFEPLRLVHDIVHGNLISKDLENSTKFELIENLFNCRFPTYYVHHLRHWEYAVYESREIKRTCRSNGGCGQTTAEDFSDSCKSREIVAMKVIRLDSLELLKPLVVEQGMNLKIIHLVRDPRGVANSRKTLYRSWENRSIDKLGLTDSLKQYCQWMADLTYFSSNLPEWMKGRYKILRYEDAAMEPLQTAKAIYRYLGLPFSKSVRLWLGRNTKQDALTTNNMNTKRNSTAASQAWRTRLAFRDVKIIQSFCSKQMKSVGYQIIDSENEMRNLAINILSG